MERGVRVLVYILCGAMLVGAIVLLAHPAYRSSLRAWAQGDITEGPVWQSNRAYYPQTGGVADEP